MQEADDIQGRRCSPPMRRSRRSAGSCSSSCRSRRPTRRSIDSHRALGRAAARWSAARVPRRACPGAPHGGADPGACAHGAARIGSGDLGQRIAIRTGDELEGLADQFNDMAGKLQESYADLEQKVETRTRELARSVGELRALGEVSQAVNSTLDLETVLNTIVSKAAQLAGTEAGAIYVYDQSSEEFRLRATYGMRRRV